MRVSNKVALITGSTRHTGYGIAEKFIQEGAVVAVNGRNTADVSEVAKKLRVKYDTKIIECPGSISSEEDVDVMYKKLLQETEKIDILVNNACSLGVGYNFLDTPTSLWDDVIAVNIRGLFLCSQRAARIMADQNGGAIVNIGSTLGQRAILNRTAYVTTKGAIEAATRAIALDLAPHGIRVNSVLPGYIHTSRWEDLSDDVRSIRRNNVPLGAESTYEDVANAVVFLSSVDAKNITGSSLVVDGGCSAQWLPKSVDT